jgi:glutamate-1-semialdehyde 2,1-aminomutase
MASDASPLDQAMVTRLRTISAEEHRTFTDRTSASQAWLAQARDAMPSGVPAPWMVGLYSHSPVVATSGSGARFTDLDGHDYIDFNLCDLAMAAGFASPPIVEAVSRQIAIGSHFLLPVEDALEVSRLLTERFGLPQWQFTLSASGANVDALRLARAFTGRRKVVVFGAKYHGHLEEMMWEAGNPEALGLAPQSGDDVVTVPFNDLFELERALNSGDVAAVVTEPVLTNCGLVLPQPNFHDELRRLCSDSGALLVIDETHTQFAKYGGGTLTFDLSPDLMTGGKGIGGGVPIGVIGMSEPLATYAAEHVESDYSDEPGVAGGGTLYGNALSLAAARAGLSEVFTPDAHERVEELGDRLQQGLQWLVDARGLPFTIDRWGGRTQWRLTPEAPITGADGYLSTDRDFAKARRLYFLNRGVWDAIATSGPGISFAAEDKDVDIYLDVAASFLDALQ